MTVSNIGNIFFDNQQQSICDSVVPETQKRGGMLIGYTLSRKLQNTLVNKWQREGDGDLTTFDLKPGLRTLTCPTLIICGAEDFITAPINSEHIKENIPHAEYHCLERACHDVYNDRPDVVFPLIKDFANRIAPREYL